MNIKLENIVLEELGNKDLMDKLTFLVKNYSISSKFPKVYVKRIGHPINYVLNMDYFLHPGFPKLKPGMIKSVKPINKGRITDANKEYAVVSLATNEFMRIYFKPVRFIKE